MIGIMGGTFDPIHFGHLRPALEIAEQCGMEQIRFIPGSIPPHRPQPLATPEQRWEMVQRAISGEARFIADRRELDREGASYTVDTLSSLRADFGDAVPMGFIMGMDAFLSFRSWKRWEAILGMVHLIVTHRPGYEPDMSDWYGDIRIYEHCELQEAPGGRVAFQAVTQLDVSATFIRESCLAGRSPQFLLPEAVREFILGEGLYAP